MRFRRVCRVTAACGLGGVALVATSLPADGVQTAKFGLSATGARSKIVHVATDAPISDSVLVYNRTGSSLPVSLDVVGVTQKSDGSYSLGAPETGLASHVHLQTRSVTLAAKERRTIPLTIDPPSSLRAPEYAAVTAVAGPASSPGLSVTERLAVLVGLTPPGARGSSSSHGSSHTRAVAIVVATVLLLALLALLASWFTLRRRRSTPAAG